MQTHARAATHHFVSTTAGRLLVRPVPPPAPGELSGGSACGSSGASRLPTSSKSSKPGLVRRLSRGVRGVSIAAASGGAEGRKQSGR